MATKYSDLTVTELLYLHKNGSRKAMAAIRERARKGDKEARHYAQGSNVNSSRNGSNNMGEMLSPTDFIMPHKLIQRAIEARGNVEEGARLARGGMPGIPGLPSPRGIARGIRSRLAGKRSPRLPSARVAPPPTFQKPVPKWGVFIDFSQEPEEVFDTLQAANAWAATIPPDVFFAVIQEGQEPPRAPFGANAPLSSDMLYGPRGMAQGQGMEPLPGVRQPTGYEQYQLSQGQRI